MKSFIKENPALVFGLGLPMLLVLIFSIAANLPNINATPPKYDVVFATNYNNNYGNGRGYNTQVVNGSFHLSFDGTCGYYQPPTLYRYHAATGSISRIDYVAPAEAKTECPSGTSQHNLAAKNVTIEVPELSRLTFNNANPSPDGYTFTSREYYSNSGIIPSLLFSSRSYQQQPGLRKGTYFIRLPMEQGDYSYYNSYLIGWIEPAQ